MKSTSQSVQNPDLSDIEEARWQCARQRMEAIAPLLKSNPLSRSEVKLRSEAIGKSPATLYRWFSLWRKGETLSCLLPRIPGPAPGQTRFPRNLEEIITNVLEGARGKLPRQSAARLMHRVTSECKRAGLTPPHPTTLRRRLKSQNLQDKRRPIYGSFPGADEPLAVVQIDHGKLDVVVVDEHERHALGRPWLTLAIDVYSRTIVGFYLSLDPPGTHSVGLCLANAILPKELWLAKLNVEQLWPIFGLMDVVHVDNGREFHSKTLERATQEWGIQLKWRPVRRPWYGGHIERLIGTVAKELHQLPGTTMSKPDEREGYDSQRGAALTLSELERWLVLWITGVYHERVHREIGTSPIIRYQEALRSSGLEPRAVTDANKFRLDFMPLYERSVARDGIRLDGVCYWSDVLKPYVEARDSDDPGKKRRFLIRRDPRDVSAVWFWDAETFCYHRIPYRNLSHPATSVWELREAYRCARDKVAGRVTETDLFQAYERMHQIENDALQQTRAARRAKASRTDQVEPPKAHFKSAFKVPENIIAFEEIEDL